MVDLRGGILRAKSVCVQEPLFQAEVEQHDLAGALDAWRAAVQGVGAAAALQVAVAETEVVLAVGR